MVKEVLENNKIKTLESRIDKLEAEKKNNLTMFGRSYSQVGNSNSDFLIKTKGQVKIQWGNKFIDLIKEGKINVDASFIFSVKSVDKIGAKNGIYLTDDGMVYLKIEESIINLIGEVGNTYVSFLGQQETNSEAKYTALRNIGFICPDINSYDTNSLQNGIIYIESEQKLYVVKDGKMTELSVQFPNPFTKQFVIQKNDSDIGALLIQGEGLTNSIAFDSFFIFTEEGIAYLQSGQTININIKDVTYINVTEEKTTITNVLQANTIQSLGGGPNSGFILYIGENGSTLIVDNLIVRNAQNSSSTQVFPTEWYAENNVVKSVTSVDDQNEYILNLSYNSNYKVGDSLYFYANVYNSEEEKNIQTKIPLTITSVDAADLIKVTSSGNFDNIQEFLTGAIIFLVGSLEPKTILKRSEKGIDLINSSGFEDEKSINTIQSRLGNLTELELKECSEGIEIPIKGYGNYSEQAYYKKAGYTKEYNLPEDDNSTRFASTEWVNKKLPINPGYYWAKEVINEKPTSAEYIGTTDQGFQVTEEKPYLLYTNDGKVWSIVSKYIAPSADKIYILSTEFSLNVNTATDTSQSWPSGFLCYYKDGQSVKTDFGVTNYIPIESLRNGLHSVLQLSTILDNEAQAGNIPQMSGYFYLWSINQNADKSNPTDWSLESSGSIPVVINYTNADDWGNSTIRPGYEIWEVNSDNTIIGKPSETEYIEGSGTKNNWDKPIWRKSFLEFILSQTLGANLNNYDDTFGWRFNWSGVLRSIGYAGYWAGRIGGIQAPTSNDPNNIGYFPTATIENISGSVSDNGITVQFIFTNVKIGKVLPYRFALKGYFVGDKIYGSSSNILYEATYEKCYYKITSDYIESTE